MEVDYVVVGAGSAGCVLAHRLSQDPGTTVALVERGGPDRHPMLHVPKGFYVTMQNPAYASRYLTEPVTADGEEEVWLRGKVLGGSSAINGMVYARGDAAGYDELAAAGNPGWAWADLLPVYRAMEDHQLGPSPLRGAGGPLAVSVPQEGNAVTAAMVEAAGALGVPYVADVNAAEGQRIGATPATIRGGVRVSAATAFLHPVRHRKNLTVLSSTRVGRLMFDGARVVGVRARRGGTTTDLRARREVILAAGTVESPLLLERSGIGDPEVLARAGIPLRVARPNVGERVVEQRAVTVKARLHADLGHNLRLNTPLKRARAGARYLLTRRGPIATAAYELSAVLASREGQRPDIQLLLTAMSTDDSGLAPADYPGLMVQGYALRPTTTSSVHAGGPSPEDPPLIRPRFLRSEADREIAGHILQRQRELLATEPLAGLVRAEVAPGAQVTTTEDAVRYALQTGTGIYHAVGSCRMGPDDDDVVDPRLRVRGVHGLRVVDASVFPTPLSGGTSAPTMAAAWRAAELIEEES